VMFPELPDASMETRKPIVFSRAANATSTAANLNSQNHRRARFSRQSRKHDKARKTSRHHHREF